MTLIPPQLEAVSCDTFQSRFFPIGTVEGLYAALKRSPEVRSLHAAIQDMTVGKADLDAFVRSLAPQFVQGEQFVHQMALASIAVACVGIPMGFAREFVETMATMKSAEILVASQVAQYALRFISKTDIKTLSRSGTTQSDTSPRWNTSRVSTTTVYCSKPEVVFFVIPNIKGADFRAGQAPTPVVTTRWPCKECVHAET